MIELFQNLPTILASAPPAEPTGIAALGLDPWGFLAQAVTFLVLLLGIKKFALGKIVAILEERRKTIDKGVRLGIEMQKEKTELDDKVEALLHKARLQADVLIAQGQEEARGIIHEAEEVALRKAETLLEESQNQLAEDIKRAKRELKTEMVELVGEATGILLRQKVDASKDSKLIESLLGEIK
ncbi:MAG: F0F1 ATP synthase subunit B [Candidatus Saccharimonadales bacterium]